MVTGEQVPLDFQYLSKKCFLKGVRHLTNLTMSSPRRKRNPLNSKEVEQQITSFASKTASKLCQLIKTKLEPSEIKKY